VTNYSPEPTGPPPIEFEQATDSALIELISGGSVPAFAALFDRTSEAVRTELAIDLPGTARVSEIFAASYVEVWWLAGCGRRVEADVTAWIIGIVRRRIAEASRQTPPRGEHTVWEALRPSYAELEIATLLRRPLDRLLGA
jgi:hypothetical protein